MSKATWNIKPEDVAKQKLVKPGWHLLRVTFFDYKEAKSGESNNAIWKFEVQSPEFKGAEITVYFNEQYPEYMTNLLLGLGFQETPEGINAQLDSETLVGKLVMGKVERGDYKGKPQNQISEYAPVTK